MTDTSTSQTAPNATASTSAAPQASTSHAQTETTHTQPTTATETHVPADGEHPKKHGVAALIEKIVHPIHGSNHTHSHTDTVNVPVAVPENPSDGGAHLAPGGNAVGGIM